MPLSRTRKVNHIVPKLAAGVQMSMITKLMAMVGEVAGGGGAEPGVGPDQLAVAALLVHVARADGRFDAAERGRLMELLMARFGWPDDAVRRLVDRADGLDRDVDDIAELIDMAGHSLHGGGDKRQLVAMAYEVAAADGHVAEFEEDLVWRLGHLLGLADPDIAAIRNGALGGAARPADRIEALP